MTWGHEFLRSAGGRFGGWGRGLLEFPLFSGCFGGYLGGSGFLRLPLAEAQRQYSQGRQVHQSQHRRRRTTCLFSFSWWPWCGSAPSRSTSRGRRTRGRHPPTRTPPCRLTYVCCSLGGRRTFCRNLWTSGGSCRTGIWRNRRLGTPRTLFR